jgi:thymidylate kinase
MVTPEGINDSKHDKEITIALEKIGYRTGGNPVKEWKNTFEKTKKGYKEIFSKFAESCVEINNESIEDFLNDC